MTAAFEATAFEATAFEVSTSSAPVSTTASITTVPVLSGSEDHVTAAIARLPEQFRDRTNIVNLVRCLVNPTAWVEYAGWQLLTLRSIYTATGSTLDAIGGIVNQLRNGLSDDDYRRYLLARVRANSSDGVPDQLLAICRLVINDAAVTLRYRNTGVAAYEILAETAAVPSAVATIVQSFLLAATSAGVRGVFRWWSSTSSTLTFPAAAFLSGAVLVGATTLNVDSTAGFPDAGTLSIDLAGGLEDIISYTGRTATSFTGCTGVSNAHDAGSACVYATSSYLDTLFLAGALST